MCFFHTFVIGDMMQVLYRNLLTESTYKWLDERGPPLHKREWIVITHVFFVCLFVCFLCFFVLFCYQINDVCFFTHMFVFLILDWLLDSDNLWIDRLFTGIWSALISREIFQYTVCNCKTQTIPGCCVAPITFSRSK